jgi:hypothetical protein
MSASIRETVVSALTNAGVSEYQQSSYTRYIDAVVNALEAQQVQPADEAERGYVLIENLVAAGQRLGLGLGRYEEELISTIEQATGLTRRPAPEPEVDDLEGLFSEGDSEAGVGQKLDAILTSLGAIARTQTEQAEAIAALKGLAKSRLGVNL